MTPLQCPCGRRVYACPDPACVGVCHPAPEALCPDPQCDGTDCGLPHAEHNCPYAIPGSDGYDIPTTYCTEAGPLFAELESTT